MQYKNKGILTHSTLFLLFLFLFPSQAFAHKIHVFAWVSGDRITVESQFSSNRPLIEGKVIVKDKAANTILLEGTGNRKGIFTFQIPQQAKEESLDLLIIVSGGEGHQSEWLVPAREYLPQQEQVHTSHAPKTTLPKTPTQEAVKGNQDELTRIVAELLEKELAPIKRSLARAEEKKTTISDILGGIGYLLGLAGLAAWMKNRPDREDKKKND